MLEPGLYEKLINESLKEQIDQSSDHEFIEYEKIDSAEASKIIAQYISGIVERKLDDIASTSKKEDVQHDQISFANQIVHNIKEVSKVINDDKEEEKIEIRPEGEQLLSVIDKHNNAAALQEEQNIRLPRPETSISNSSLFTGSYREPQLFSELKKEILSSNEIEMLVSFIRWSGLRLIIDELRAFTEIPGNKLRVITTSYMGATDVHAVEELAKLNNTEIKISYDTTRTRLHAKAYIFYRRTGFSTAYVGSSNLSNAAMSSGLEWNMKITCQDQPDIMKKIRATFESYWASEEFEMFALADKDRLKQAIQAEHKLGNSDAGINPYVMDVIPYSYQQEILDKLQAEREIRGFHKNLVVAATGTGKTVIAALDYRRYCRKENRGNPVHLLFVAHREEILKQSIETFRSVMKDPDFGALLVGREKHPDTINQLFISIQTFRAKEFQEITSPDFYDFIIVDEFHHAAAPSYQLLLTYYNPKILLGLTATPERMDRKSILTYFDNRIAAEIRLPEAIDRKMLCPFQYFGVSDTVDLENLRWSRGGYDKNELENVYVFTGEVAQRRAAWIVQETLRYVTDIGEVKGLGFCVSKEHARFMSDYFNQHGIPSMYLTSESSNEERENAKKRLENGEIKFNFVVDLYNEGIDIKPVNTILFLRPTESLTVFQQQLGRGLRLAEGKECLTVLDFIGQANKKYNFEEKFASIMSVPGNVRKEIRNGFVSVPRGCYIQLEKKARKAILDTISAGAGTKQWLISRIRTFTEDTGRELTLSNFLEYYHMDIRQLYSANNKAGWSRLNVWAGVKPDFDEPMENILTGAFSRICSIDSRRWIHFLLNELPGICYKDFTSYSDGDLRMLRMLQYTIWNAGDKIHDFHNLYGDMTALTGNPVMLQEMYDILNYSLDHLDFIDERVPLGFECPLDLHCHYTKNQILIALDYKNVSSMRQGVCYIPEKKCDILINTLNKADKEYSPSTMYDDYSINEWLFHWQSQSTTSDSSPTGQRYIHHDEMGNRILLFVREYKKDIAGTAPYMFLGTVHYVRHEGSRPMNIIWKLDKPIPAKFIRKSEKLIAQ